MLAHLQPAYYLGPEARQVQRVDEAQGEGTGGDQNRGGIEASDWRQRHVPGIHPGPGGVDRPYAGRHGCWRVLSGVVRCGVV